MKLEHLNSTNIWFPTLFYAQIYHVFAENDQVFYSAYVSQQNLTIDDSQIPVEHPDVPVFFGGFDGKSYEILEHSKN